MAVTLDELKGEQADSLGLSVEAYRRTLEMLLQSDAGAAIARAARLLGEANRIALFGLGPSVPLLKHAGMHLRRIGRRVLVLGGTGESFADQLLEMAKGDCLLALSYGRVSREGLLAAREIARHGGKVVVVTENRAGQMARLADQVLMVPRTEVGNTTLYGIVLLVLECIALGLTRLNPELALESATELRDFRNELG